MISGDLTVIPANSRSTPGIHKAEPHPAFPRYCLVCTAHIKSVPGGSGTTWVHTDSGAVAAPGERPPGENIPVSPYAMRHPEFYELVPVMWQGGFVTHTELRLVDREGVSIDEAGCNCDMDRPCNNPLCVMDRGRW